MITLRCSRVESLLCDRLRSINFCEMVKFSTPSLQIDNSLSDISRYLKFMANNSTSNTTNLL